MRLQNGQQHNCRLTFNTRNFLKMAQCQQRLLTNGIGVNPSGKENPQMFLHTRLMMEETTLMMINEMRLVMKEKEKLFPMKKNKTMIQNSISSV